MRKFYLSKTSLYTLEKKAAKKNQFSGVRVGQGIIGYAKWLGKCLLVMSDMNYVRTSPIVAARKLKNGYTVKTQNGSTYKLLKAKPNLKGVDIDGILPTE